MLAAGACRLDSTDCDTQFLSNKSPFVHIHDAQLEACIFMLIGYLSNLEVYLSDEDNDPKADASTPALAPRLCSLTSTPLESNKESANGMTPHSMILMLLEESIKWTTELPELEVLFSILQKVRKKMNLRGALHAHTLICDLGLELHKDLGNYLIPLFVDCGSPSDAQQVFSRLLHRNEYSWTALLQGCLGSHDAQHVFDMYQQMQQDGVQPSRFTFVPLLTACMRLQSLERGMQLHEEIILKGFEEDIFLAYALVILYARCGSLMETEKLFHSLPSRDTILWTEVIYVYVEQGLSEKALHYLEQMQLEHVVLDTISYVCGLKACSSSVAVDKGHNIHADIVRKGMDIHVLVANTLVNMYSKCGSLEDAKDVFDKLQDRDVVTWTALVVAYAEHGLSAEALNCVEQMESEGIHGDVFILSSGLKACANLGALESGQKVHAQIVKQGLESFSFIGSTLTDMYCSCSHFEEAQDVFYALPTLDTVAWNVLISRYADLGLGEKALDVFEEMHKRAVPQDPVTYFSSLKACGDCEDLHRGQQIHAQITRAGFGIDAIVGNTLVFMYAKCGSFSEAMKVFDDLLVRDVVSWTSLIVGLADRGFGKEAMYTLEQMQSMGVPADNVTLVFGLRICGMIGDSGRGYAMHAEMIKKGFDVPATSGTHLVDMYANCGLLSEAHATFRGLPIKDIAAWNAIILGCTGQGAAKEALHHFKQMPLENIAPDAATFVGILKLCDSSEAMQTGLLLHASIVKQGFDRDDVVGKGLVEMYIKCSDMKSAHEILYKMPVGNILSWNALISMYVDQGLYKDALLCFPQMQFQGLSPDRGSWNGLVLAYAEQGQSEKAVDLYLQMQGQSLIPDAMVLSSLLKACGCAIMLELGRRLHTLTDTPALMDVNLATCFIDMYARCGSMTEAQQLFDAMPARDIVTWDALMRGYASHGDTDLVFHLLERLMKESLQPDEVIFLAILSLCKHVGLPERGKKYLEVMSLDYDLTPSIKHFTCMIDLLGRSGDLYEALQLVNQMPFQPSLVVWHTVLGACQKGGSIELGRLAYEQAVGLDRKHGTAHVLMANMYADAHLWEEVEKIQNMRT